MYRRIDMAVCPSIAAHWNGAGTVYPVQTVGGALYLIYVGSDSDVYFAKSTDNGVTWNATTAIFSGTTTCLSVWYDRWSGIAAGLIHVAYQESGTDDIRYRTINTESSDALSTETVVLAGTDTAGGGWMSIARARGGNVYIYGCIDAGSEGGFFRLPNANVPNGAWDAARANPEALSSTDQAILVPGFGADTQDMMCMFIDASANQIDRYVYDDSANSWANTNIGSITEVAASTHFPHFAATVDLTNSQIILAYWNAVDAANADLQVWTITESAITAKTDVITNSTDDQGFAAVALDLVTGHWLVFYGGPSSGADAFPQTNLYYKVSTDAGSTWGPESSASNNTFLYNVKWMACTPRFSGHWTLAWFRDMTLDVIYVSAPIVNPCIGHQLAG